MHTMHYQTLMQQIPLLRTCQAEMTHSASQLQENRQLGRMGVHWYVMLGLDTLAEVHAAAMCELEQQRYLTTQTLARSGITHAINVLYVLSDPEADRLSGGLRHHLDERRARADAWRAVAPADQVVLAQQYGQHLTAFSRAQPWYANAPRWPSLCERADAIGWGEWVHPALLGAANHEQALAQEVLNTMECEQRSSEPERKAAHELRNTKHGSDAVYLEAIALRMFAQALQHAALILGDAVATTVAESTASQIDPLLAEHQRVADLLQEEDSNIYIRMGG
ncbi:hypothetical protein DWU99_18435 [Dyella psychrodurans]|uniref:Uncharacterized protein n=2 Tax=Dyella psychrodurans TaxID=1927960 RepID=A0A370WY31_9GAMM|nr:hypothetical protein DWU99_18435 [Dyella psychrodurans]